MLSATLCLAMIAGCQTPPRIQADAPKDIATATGMASSVEFVAVGPDGGPLDEIATTSDALTLSEALRRAVTTDPGIQAAMARVRGAAADADQSRLLPNPVLNVVLRWGPGKPQIETSVTQDLVQALQIRRRASAADNRLRQSVADAVTVAIDVVSEVQERYVAAQASGALIPILRERMQLLERLVAVAKARLDVGEGTRSDLATLQAQVVELQVDIDQASLAQREERVRLARLIGEPSSSALWTLDDWKQPESEIESESTWVQQALIHRQLNPSCGNCVRLGTTKLLRSSFRGTTQALV